MGIWEGQPWQCLEGFVEHEACIPVVKVRPIHPAMCCYLIVTRSPHTPPCTSSHSDTLYHTGLQHHTPTPHYYTTPHHPTTPHDHTTTPHHSTSPHHTNTPLHLNTLPHHYTSPTHHTTPHHPTTAQHLSTAPQKPAVRISSSYPGLSLASQPWDSRQQQSID